MKPWVALCVAVLVAAHPVGGMEAGAAPDGKMAQAKAGEAGPAVPGGATPLQAIHAHLCGLHFYSGDMQRQVVAHHYCAHWSEDVWQCVLYDSDQADARLIGIEYVVSEKLFRSLPEEEKKLWHSHAYEVKSGLLVAPRLSSAAEKELMTQLVGTYGKTWQTWSVDRGGQVPLGIPQLMMSFTADGQAKPELIATQERGEISAVERKKSRAEIVAPTIQPGADAWQEGEAVQLQTKVQSRR